MHKLLTLATIFLVSAACETTQDRIARSEAAPAAPTERLSNGEKAAIRACSYGNSQACIDLSIYVFGRGNDSFAIELADLACSQGSAKGCELKQELLGFSRELMVDRRQRYREEQAARSQQARDEAIIQLIQNATQPPPAPQQTRCISKWNSFLRQQETVCE